MNTTARVGNTLPTDEPTSADADVDIYALERERQRQNRLAHEERKKSLSGAGGGLGKRSYGESMTDEAPTGAPTGPRADRGGRKRRMLEKRD